MIIIAEFWPKKSHFSKKKGGLPVFSGDYILVGKALETETATKTLAFAIKREMRKTLSLVALASLALYLQYLQLA